MISTLCNSIGDLTHIHVLDIRGEDTVEDLYSKESKLRVEVAPRGVALRHTTFKTSLPGSSHHILRAIRVCLSRYVQRCQEADNERRTGESTLVVDAVWRSEQVNDAIGNKQVRHIPPASGTRLCSQSSLCPVLPSTPRTTAIRHALQPSYV